MINPANLICKEIFTIDPGKSNGGICKFLNNNIESWAISKMNDPMELLDFFREQKELCEKPLVILENITTYSGDYGDKNNVGRAFGLDKLKKHYAELRFAIRAAKLPFIEVMPVHWQKYLKIHIKGENYNIRKKRYKSIAEDWYQYKNITNWNCDAFLLIEFALRKLKYDPLWIHQNTKNENTILNS